MDQHVSLYYYISSTAEDLHPAPSGPSPNKNKEGADDVALNMDIIQLPSPIFNFEATMADKLAISCFPLAGREVLCMDNAGRTFLFDADTRDVVTMTDLHKPKRWPFSLFVPSNGMDDDDSSGSLFI
uniref:Uncharacterized protein n=1 Tax=Oryza meridionalis TaxID=40149 RepID=A0A0E0CBR5_9ORYZ